MEVKTPADLLRTPVDMFRRPKRHEGVVAPGRPDASYRAFELLYVCFIVTPFITGLGKLAGAIANWADFVHPSLAGPDQVLGFVKGLGVLELALALVVALHPRIGGFAVAAWLGAGIINLLAIPGHYGIALACFALGLCAIGMSFLAKDYQRGTTENR